MTRTEQTIKRLEATIDQLTERYAYHEAMFKAARTHRDTVKAMNGMTDTHQKLQYARGRYGSLI